MENLIAVNRLMKYILLVIFLFGMSLLIIPMVGILGGLLLSLVK